MQNNNKRFTYEQAGVNIQAGNQLAAYIKGKAASIMSPNVLSGIGGFSSLFRLDLTKYPKPILVSGTDGVGTKLKIAEKLNIHNTIGIDLVAMSVNDILVCGAKPLFFLDYYATGKLNNDIAKQVMEGIVEGCRQSDMSLVGGETAEMPSMYADDVYDLAGFVIGVVNEPDIIDGSKVREGDLLIGIPSSGLHSNGFSLVRKIFLESREADLEKIIPELGHSLGAELLKPTIIYTSLIEKLLSTVPINAMAHITGGGITENLPRVIPSGHSAEINLASWRFPWIFRELQSLAHLENNEMLKTFNCGIGMILVVPPSSLSDLTAVLRNMNQDFYQIGKIVSDSEGMVYYR